MSRNADIEDPSLVKQLCPSKLQVFLSKFYPNSPFSLGNLDVILF